MEKIIYLYACWNFICFSFPKSFPKVSIYYSFRGRSVTCCSICRGFVGLGLGIVFRFGGTTGGVDILARLGHKYFGWSMGKTMFIFDAIVIILSWLTFLDARSMMYTLVAVFVGARVIDFVQEGAYAARGALIISEKSSAIAEMIALRMERGITILEGHGHFTKQQKK